MRSRHWLFWAAIINKCWSINEIDSITISSLDSRRRFLQLSWFKTVIKSVSTGCHIVIVITPTDAKLHEPCERVALYPYMPRPIMLAARNDAWGSVFTIFKCGNTRILALIAEKDYDWISEGDQKYARIRPIFTLILARPVMCLRATSKLVECWRL